MNVKWNVYYTWQGELHVAGQFDSQAEANNRASELIAERWNGVHVRPTQPVYDGGSYRREYGGQW